MNKAIKRNFKYEEDFIEKYDRINENIDRLKNTRFFDNLDFKLFDLICKIDILFKNPEFKNELKGISMKEEKKLYLKELPSKIEDLSFYLEDLKKLI